ncbi:MAG: hypothetical protein H0Z39_07450 [Peptococcaceae bacterium]|nr:hypothetical protein [Peptococcaceae bacterium]
MQHQCLQRILVKHDLVDQVLNQMVQGSVVVNAAAGKCVLRRSDGWEIAVTNGPDGDLKYIRLK